MALVRALLRTPVKDLTVVSYGGPDVGLLAAAGKIRKLYYGFVSLDSIALEPHFRAARQQATIPELVEYDEGHAAVGRSTPARCGCRSSRPVPASDPA